MHKFITIAIFLLAQIAGGQTTEYEIKQINTEAKISLNSIIGNWYTADANASRIRFIKINDYFVDIDGIHHGAGGNYSFRLDGDSVSVNGSAPNWPPYDCTLRLINDSLLEIEFYTLLSPSSTKNLYKR